MEKPDEIFVFWKVALIVLMMEAASTYETSINFYQTTRRNIPQRRHLQSETLIAYPDFWRFGKQMELWQFSN
jgi:hypothetical protein